MNIFPAGIAEGAAFCNRTAERKKLAGNIGRVIHTILLGPRRYGKTSLIRQVLNEHDFNYEWVDFLSVTTAQQVEEKLAKATKALLFKLSPELTKLTKNTVDFVKSMSPELNLSAMGQSLTFQLTSNAQLPLDQLLLNLDDYAQKMGKKAALVFDEFQQISELENNHSVEALIRHAVERSKAITYIFSGSNRHLLQEMFSKSTRPLYRLCQAMPIQRIVPAEYEGFINKAALERWGDKLATEALAEIMRLTECHPFYVNGLCSDLWELDAIPEAEAVIRQWEHYIETHKGIIVSDIVGLPLNQKKVIQALAISPSNAPFAHEFCLKTKLASGSVRRALEYLLKKDIAYIDDDGIYRLLDPAIRYYLLKA